MLSSATRPCITLFWCSPQDAYRLSQRALLHSKLELAGQRAGSAADADAALRQTELASLDGASLRYAHLAFTSPYRYCANLVPLLSLLRCSERAARVETEVAEARAAVQAATQRAEGLISQLAELQTVPVLFSDTDVKLARQTYFTSKQNKVGTLAAWMCTRHNMT